MNFSRNGKGTGETPGVTSQSAATSDAELVYAARRGDKRAFMEIVARHQAMVCGIALGILGDFAASEDAGQEAFLTAWRKFHELREPERLRAWLAQIARNAALGHRRKIRGSDPLESAMDLADESLAPDQAAAKEEEANLVRVSLAKLPETYRLPLVLFYREGQSVRAVAETLNISEDAVKQRLARGREMLRDEMSGLIENVLTRTGPSPVFTMTIAVAIGALVTPAVMAGTAFAATSTAASAVASSSTTTTSTSFLTVMSSSKTFLAVTALVAVAFIPVGYNLSTAEQRSAESKLVIRADAVLQAPASPTTPSFENSAFFAEWLELHEKHGINAAAMPSLYKAIAEIKDPFRRRAFHSALIAEWVQLDAPGGLKFYLDKGPDNAQRRQFIEEWLALDAMAATDALLASAPGWEKMASGCLSEIARRAPSRLAEITTRLPETENYWDTTVSDAFAIVAAGNLNSARKWAEAMTGPHREQALIGVARAWAKSNFQDAVAWARTLPEGIDQNQIIRAALMGAATVNPAVALDSVNLIPSGGRPSHFADTTGARVLSKAAETDFDATVRWVQDHPGRFGREELLGLAHAVTDRLNANATDFLNTCAASGSLAALVPAIESALLNQAGGQRAEIWEWLKTQPDNEATKSLKDQIISSAAWQDPAFALKLASDIPQTKEGDRQIQDLAKRLFNGEYSLHRFDKLLDQTPERLRPWFVEAAFSSIGTDIVEPGKWIERLALLPESSREKGIARIAQAWATQAPEEALVWASSFTGNTRAEVMSTVASSWASKDAHGAADWVATLPSGADRDRIAESLATTISEKYPREAWEWALSINDPMRRRNATIAAAREMSRQDKATAQQWIETGPFTPEVRAELQSAIERHLRSEQ